MARFKKVEFTAEQKTKIAEMTKKFVGEMQALRKESQSLLTPEQRKARGAAMKAARAEGKKWKDIEAEINKATKIDESAMSKMKELQKKMQSLQKSNREAIEKLLTDEQKSSLPKPRKNAGKGKGKKKNSDKKAKDKKADGDK